MFNFRKNSTSSSSSSPPQTSSPNPISSPSPSTNLFISQNNSTPDSPNVVINPVRSRQSTPRNSPRLSPSTSVNSFHEPSSPTSANITSDGSNLEEVINESTSSSVKSSTNNDSMEILYSSSPSTPVLTTTSIDLNEKESTLPPNLALNLNDRSSSFSSAASSNSTLSSTSNASNAILNRPYRGMSQEIEVVFDDNISDNQSMISGCTNEVDWDENESIIDGSESNRSVASSSFSIPASTPISPTNTTSSSTSTGASAPRRKSTFFGLFGGGSTAAAPPSSSASTPPPVSTPTTSTTYQNRDNDLVNATKRPLNTSLKVTDPILSSIGRQIRLLELEAKKLEDSNIKRWREEVKPKLEKNILELEKQIVQYNHQMEKEIDKGIEHINKLEGERDALVTKQDTYKKELYFPNPLTLLKSNSSDEHTLYTPTISLGTNGVYMSMNDYWLEYTTGTFSIELVPMKGSEKEKPTNTNSMIRINFMGSKSPSNTLNKVTNSRGEIGGISSRLQLEKFRLVGDKGKGIPKLSFDILKITISFNLSIIFVYNPKLKKWELNPKDFLLSIVSFKGPYGLNRSIVSLVLSLVTPLIRRSLIQLLPFELSDIINSFSSTVNSYGEFSLHGLDLNILNTEIFNSNTLSTISSLSPIQLEFFYWLQKSLDRTTIHKNLSEIIQYVRQYSPYREIWKQLVQCWNQAAIVYSEKLTELYNQNFFTGSLKSHFDNLKEKEKEKFFEKQKEKERAQERLREELKLKKDSIDEKTPSPDFSSSHSYDLDAEGYYSFFNVSFTSLINLCKHVLTKRVSLKFNLQSFNGQFLLNKIINHIHAMLYRISYENLNKVSPLKRLKLENFLTELNEKRKLLRDLLLLFNKNINFVQFSILLFFITGSSGYLKVKLNDFIIQLPLILKLLLSNTIHIGALSLVPYIVTIKPNKKHGDLHIDIFHFSHNVEGVPKLIEEKYKKSTGNASLDEIQDSINQYDQNLYQSSGGLSINPPSNSTTATSSISPTPQPVIKLDTFLSQQDYTNYDISLKSGCYISSYNRAVTKATVGDSIKRGVDFDSSSPSLSPSTPIHSSSSPTNPSSPTKIPRHLLVESNKSREQLLKTLQDHPDEDTTDLLLSVRTKSAHISIISDNDYHSKTEKEKPGTELFTAFIGDMKDVSFFKSLFY